MVALAPGAGRLLQRNLQADCPPGRQAVDILREPHPTSLIAQERVDPGPPGWGFSGTALALALIVVGVAGYLGLQPEASFPVETAAAGTPGSIAYPMGFDTARALSAVAAGAAVAGCAFAARRLSHSDGVGLLAAAIVALDPGFLTLARLAVPEMMAIACLTLALAAFLSIDVRIHWAGAAFLGVAALIDPRTLLWSLPLAAMALFRGHIYAAPRHLGIATLQAVGAPLAGAVVNLLAGGPGMTFLACNPMPGPALLLMEAPRFTTFGSAFGTSIVPVHNPVSWFGGLGALLLMGGASLWAVARQFRMARLPGRLQLRLAQPMPGPQARILWLLALALLVPIPSMWLVVFAIALAVGIGQLAEDAPGFGVAVAFVVVLFAVLALARGWPMVQGTSDAAAVAHRLVPWINVQPCSG